MLPVILSVLSIIGKIILIILGIILLLILLLLFMPIRYRIHFEKKEEESVLFSARVNWFFHLFRIQYDYPTPGTLSVKVLWFSLLHSDEDEMKKKTAEQKRSKEKKTIEKKTAEKKTVEKKTVEKKTAEKNIAEKKAIERKTAEKTIAKEAIDNEAIDNEAIDNEAIDSKRNDSEKADNEATGKKTAEKIRLLWKRICSFFIKIPSKLHSIEYTIKKLCDKIKQIISFLHEIADFWCRDDVQRTIVFSQRQLLYALRHLKPKHSKGYVQFGLEDPSDTGMIMAGYGIAYPYIGGLFQIEPDFEQQIFHADISLSGSVRLYFLLVISIRFLCSKDVRTVYKELLKKWKQWRIGQHE